MDRQTTDDEGRRETRSTGCGEPVAGVPNVGVPGGDGRPPHDSPTVALRSVSDGAIPSVAFASGIEFELAFSIAGNGLAEAGPAKG